jgi:Mn2+/Fe2+ NRAMP family transporter
MPDQMEDKKVEIKWSLGEAIKFGFGFGMGMFLWGVLLVVVCFFIIWFFVGNAIGVPMTNPSQTSVSPSANYSRLQ